MASLTSVTSSVQPLPPENSSSSSSNNLRDVSFSSYLSNREEILVHKLAAHQDLEEQHFLGRKKTEAEEIGVFSAEKYFNGGIDEDSTPRLANIVPRKHSQPKKDHEHNDLIPHVKPKVVPGTPSIVSESSWNSQTALLQNVQRKDVLQKKTSNGRSSGLNFLAGLGWRCSCIDKDSIDVDDEHVGEISFKKSPTNASGMLQNKLITEELIKTNLDLDHKSHSGSLVSEEIYHQNLDKVGIGLNKENCFSFPISNPAAGDLPSKLKIREDEELIPRKSLEVFGSPVHDKKSKSFRIERRLSMLSWDTTPRMNEIAYSAPSSGVGYNDNESDASSDLFEIESLTGKVTPFLARQGSDATSGCVTPTTCYAPSEASIEWSVVTASAADFSVMSDYEELRPSITAPSPIKIFPITANSKTSGIGKETPRLRPSIFLGCNSHKAVKVAGDAYRTNENYKAKFEPPLRRVSDSYMPVDTRFPAETKLMDFDSRQNQRAPGTTHSLPRLHPPQSSHLLYIQ